MSQRLKEFKDYIYFVNIFQHSLDKESGRRISDCKDKEIESLSQTLSF